MDDFHNINWCCKHNMRENWSMLSIWQFYSWTFSHENESISVKFTSFDCWCIWKYFCGIHISSLSAFNLLSKSLISSDSQWLAKHVLVVQLWSLHKISGQKNDFVEGEWWTVGGVWLHGHCARLKISSQSGFKPWLGTLCCVLGHNTYIVTLSVLLSLPRCINGYWLT